MAPKIIFVPGFWEGPTPFEPVSEGLQKHGFETEIVSVPSTGTTSPGNPSMKDDIAAIRTVVEKAVDADKNVVLVLHSGGGFLGSNAIEHLDIKARSEAGKSGGVSKIVFLAGAVFPPGYTHGPLPFAVVDVSHSCWNVLPLFTNTQILGRSNALRHT